MIKKKVKKLFGKQSVDRSMSPATRTSNTEVRNSLNFANTIQDHKAPGMKKRKDITNEELTEQLSKSISKIRQIKNSLTHILTPTNE